MFKVLADKKLNLLEISFSGEVNAAEAGRCVDRVETLLRDLRPGFCLLNDLSGLSHMAAECAPQMERSMDLCRKAGVAQVVRVIPDPQKDIGLNILSIFHYPRRVRIITSETREEALKILKE